MKRFDEIVWTGPFKCHVSERNLDPSDWPKVCVPSGVSGINYGDFKSDMINWCKEADLPGFWFYETVGRGPNELDPGRKFGRAGIWKDERLHEFRFSTEEAALTAALYFSERGRTFRLHFGSPFAILFLTKGGNT